MININIKFPITEVADETPDSPALTIAKDVVGNLSDDDVDSLFYYLQALGYPLT